MNKKIVVFISDTFNSAIATKSIAKNHEQPTKTNFACIFFHSYQKRTKFLPLVQQNDLQLAITFT